MTGSARIVIIGAGLSGLYAAFRLQQMGIDYVLLEARATPGGRIVTLSSAQMRGSTHDAEEPSDYYDLGPSWFWPSFQPQLARLVAELGLQQFAQHEKGDMLIERSHHSPPIRMAGFKNSPSAMRIVGGMWALADALRNGIDTERLHTGQTVSCLRRVESGVEVESRHDSLGLATWRVAHALLALPPRLAQATIDFSPALPSALSHGWAETATWMAPHAKYCAVYERAFWRDQGLSGAGRSSLGPMAEIHDASTADGRAALFGFIGIPATLRQTLDQAALRNLCLEQFTRMFGEQAAHPLAHAIKDWSMERHTAVHADCLIQGQHTAAPPSAPTSGNWVDRVSGVASEWSPIFPGYLAGAIDAVDRAIASLSL